MKKVFIYLGLLAAISSCLPVYFEQPQPAGIEAEKIFPEKLQGTYFNEGFKDILIIEELRYGFGHEGNTFKEEGQLSDSLILKKYKKNYFLNYKKDSLWNVRVISKKKNFKLSNLTMPEESQAKVKKLKLITPVKEIYDSTGEISSYIINPTKKELEKMLREDMFHELGAFIKIKIKND